MRKALLPIVALLLIVPTVSAQTVWNFQSMIEASPGIANSARQGHGIAVDPAGKIWFQPLSASETVMHPTMGVKNTAVIYVFNADGTPATISPIMYVDLPGGARDTLGGRTSRNATGVQIWEGMSGRGLRTDENGNILVMQFNILYRLNYQTGAGMNKVVYGPTGVAPAVATGNGTIFAGPVIPAASGNPLKMYDKDFNELGNALDATRGFSRSFEVSPDGNKIYWSGYTTHQVTLYERADEFSAFDSVGAVIPGVDSESMTWQPGTGWLWVAAGSSNDAPNRLPDVTTTWMPNAWYAFDPAELAVNTIPTPKAYFQWRYEAACAADPVAANCGRPRGLAFSPDGSKAYVTTFGVAAVDPIQVFSTAPVAIEKIDGSVPDRFILMPAYPNPFNPTTNINFMLHQTGHARLSVYDMTGREVAVLADQVLSSGTYEYTFDATGLTSGVYVYRLAFDGQVANGRLTLIK